MPPQVMYQFAASLRNEDELCRNGLSPVAAKILSRTYGCGVCLLFGVGLTAGYQGLCKLLQSSRKT